jgi:hypothetical protein
LSGQNFQELRLVPTVVTSLKLQAKVEIVKPPDFGARSDKMTSCPVIPIRLIFI